MSQLSTCPTFDLFDRGLASVCVWSMRACVRGESTPLLWVSLVLVLVRSSVTPIVLPSVTSIVLLPVLLPIYPGA